VGYFPSDTTHTVGANPTVGSPSGNPSSITATPPTRTPPPPPRTPIPLAAPPGTPAAHDPPLVGPRAVHGCAHALGGRGVGPYCSSFQREGFTHISAPRVHSLVWFMGTMQPASNIFLAAFIPTSTQIMIVGFDSRTRLYLRHTLTKTATW
jgi:hypothetical protein